LQVALGLAGLLLCSSVLGQQSLQSLAAGLGSADRKLMTESIAALATSSDPAALRVLQALEGDRLGLLSSGAMLEKKAGQWLDLQSGAAVRATGEVKQPLVTNTLRRSIRTAVALLQLRSKHRDERLRATEVLASGATPELAGPCRKALAAETDPEVKKSLALVIAQLDLASDQPQLRLSAVRALAELSDPALKPQIESLLARNADGSFAEPDARVRKAASGALASIERKELLVRVVRDLIYGLSLGSVLLLAALGLAVTFGLMGVINMAHGEMLMLGAYSTYVVQRAFERYAPGAIDFYLVAALPVAFVACMLLGMLLERTVIRFLYGRPLETLLATWGISLALIQTVRVVFGAQNVTVANPRWLSGGVDLMSGVVVPYARVATIGFVAVVVALLWYVLNRTPLGLQVRAITQNRRMARCVGIRTARVDMFTFGLGSAIAGLGGVALSQIGNVGPELGQSYIVDSFMVVVVGGVGNLFGTLYAALGLGAVNKLLEPIAGAVLGKIVVLGFIILFIQRRPQGLFALKGRAAES
jgi:urea transport system permease protein